MKKKIVGILIFIVLTVIPILSFGAELPFRDVSSNAWYYNDVKTAYETGLINGIDDVTFAPDSNMTYVQAVKLAACMNQKYIQGEVTLKNGYPYWYSSYVRFAKGNGIINKDYNWDSYATRAEYVEIFANALPDEAFKQKNTINDNSIPDVNMTHPQAAAIYKLYRAGILTGINESGAFSPNSTIRRSEVAAILTRMMNERERKSLSLTGSSTNFSPQITNTKNNASKYTASQINKYLELAIDNMQSGLQSLRFSLHASTPSYGKDFAIHTQNFYSLASSNILDAIKLCGDYANLADVKNHLIRSNDILSGAISYSVTTDNYMDFISYASKTATDTNAEFSIAVDIMNNLFFAN